MIRIPTSLAILALLLFAPAAGAVEEQGDTGDLPATAQDASTEDVTRIDGSFADGSDVDVYRLCLSGGGSFSASTIGGTTVDTQLFLFDAEGRGVYANDDIDGVRQSRLPANDALTPQQGGVYYLAVTPFNRDPRSPAGAIFPNVAFVVGATGPGAAEPVSEWFGRAGGSGAYTVTVTGAFCPPPDTTPPTVDLRSPANGIEVARDAAVEVDYSCADEDGGSGLASCVGSVPDGEQLDTSAEGPVSVTVTARDNAGNETSVTHTVTVVARDETAPTIDLRSPLDGAVYLLDEEVVADYSCADEDGGSGLASCLGDIADGAPVDTSTVGEKEFAVEAEDVAGNTSVARSVYRVVYDFEGFLWPVRNRPHLNEWKAGAVVPIRFELGGNHGLEVIEEGWPQVAQIECGSAEEPAAGEPARHPRWFRELVYRKRKQRYVFLWKTERDWSGSCRQFMLKLDDGTVKRANFKFVRRWHDLWD
jgi:Bacterial pre-peptidase C-terminal domain